MVGDCSMGSSRRDSDAPTPLLSHARGKNVFKLEHKRITTDKSKMKRLCRKKEQFLQKK